MNLADHVTDHATDHDLKTCEATPDKTLREHIMDSRIAKSESEWWCKREIEKLEKELAASLENQLKAIQMAEFWKAKAYGAEEQEGNVEAEVKRLKKPIKIKVSKRPYYYECGDGCCTDSGETWFVNGEEICSGMCDDNRLQQLLKHLGYEAEIMNENEDGEEVCSI